MKDAAKKGSFLLAVIALAISFCASSFASSPSIEGPKTRAELKINLAQNAPGQSHFHTVKRSVKDYWLTETALGSPLAPKGGTEKIFKAPQPGKGQKQLKDGFDPADFAEGDQRAYFAKQRELAEEYAKHYGDGVLEVEIPKDVYDARIRPHEVPYQGGPQVELPIPHKDFDVLNDAQRRLHGGGG